jgi:hypothetical protein
MPYVYRQYIYILLNMQRQKKLNSDDQVFHHYQTNEQFQKGQRYIPMEIQVLARDRHKHVAALDRLMERCECCLYVCTVSLF